MTIISTQTPPLPTPSLKRRLISFVYEALLLFGLVFFAGIVFDIATQSRHALTNRYARELMLFVVIGCYYVFFWLHGGQTLAMKTWKIKLVNLQGEKISMFQALLRYCLIWMWFIPALLIIAVFQFKQWPMVAVLCIGAFAWMLTIFTNKDRQYFHDVIAKTRLISEQEASLSINSKTANNPIEPLI